MQTFLINIDEPYVPSLLDLLKPIPKESIDIKNLNYEIDDNINMLEDEIAYRKAMNDLANGEAINLNQYVINRGLA